MASSQFCPRCAQPLPDHTPGGACPSCGSPLPPGGDTPKTQQTPATRDDDFVIGPADSNLTAPHLTATLRHETPVKRPALVVPSIRNHTNVEFLGQGGMGVVFRAIQRPTDRPVAVKVMLRFSADTPAHDRFLNEIRAQAKLKHDGIVPIYEAGDCSLGPYFTMELIHGQTLSQRMREEPLDTKAAARLIADAADAVHAAHEQGIIHRDIKPSNILLDRAGRVKVTDFGLAKHIGSEPMTETGIVVGTPSYMSPEQAEADPDKITKAADVYGLGSTLFHLVTGHAPHQRATPHATLRQKAVDPTPSPRAYAPALCPTLEAIILRSMALDPSDRFPTAAALAADLRKWADGEETETRPLTRGRRVRRAVRRNRMAIGLLTALTAAIVAVAIAVREADPKRRIDRALERGEKVVLVGAVGLPEWHDWKLGPTLLGNSLANDKTCGFNSNGTSLLTLVDDPIAASYRFSAEVRHIGGMRSTKDDLTRNAYSRVGLFWSPQSSTLSSGEVRHLVFTLDFNDIPQGETSAVRDLEPRLRQFRIEDGKVQMTGKRELKPRSSFQVSPTQPGFWRKIVLTWQNNQLELQWQDDADAAGGLRTVGRWRGEQLDQYLTDRRTTDNALQPGSGDGVTGWNPRGPLGIIAMSSTVAIRNVEIVPLNP